ncbi:HAD family hydrolase, partial [Streptomyces sp. NPDC001389]|uniref:HAD family hydrolase n=1 Tax=Streptomyces sp. NPDC001389 TaxID=3364569 RepID=UPI003680BD03
MHAVLFDVDGVLIDSGSAHDRVWKGWARLRALDPDDVFAVTQGKRRVDTLRTLVPERSEKEENRVLDQLMAAEESSICAYPGVRDLLRALPAERWAVVTSSRGEATVNRFRAQDLPVPAVRVCAEGTCPRVVDTSEPGPGRGWVGGIFYGDEGLLA